MQITDVRLFLSRKHPFHVEIKTILSDHRFIATSFLISYRRQTNLTNPACSTAVLMEAGLAVNQICTNNTANNIIHLYSIY